MSKDDNSFFFSLFAVLCSYVLMRGFDFLSPPQNKCNSTQTKTKHQRNTGRFNRFFSAFEVLKNKKRREKGCKKMTHH